MTKLQRIKAWSWIKKSFFILIVLSVVLKFETIDKGGLSNLLKFFKVLSKVIFLFKITEKKKQKVKTKADKNNAFIKMCSML